MGENNHIASTKSIYIISSFVVLAGILFLAISNSFYEYMFWGDVIRDIGIALVIAGSVGLSLEYHLQTHTLMGIEQSIADIVNVIKEVIHKEETLLGECESIGLIKVYKPHSKTGPNSEFDRDILKQLIKETSFLKIYGVSARHFFHHERKYYSNLRDAAKKGVLIKAMLVNPFSDSAKKRARLEEEIDGKYHYFQSKVFNEIMLSSFIINKGAITGMNKENIRFYSEEPAFFLFICSDFLIIEPYHSGKIDTDEMGIVGGHVPSFKFKKDSDAYVRLNAHFDNCFNNSSKTLSEVITKYESISSLISNSTKYG